MYALLSLLARSKNRRIVLQQLSEARTPTEISKNVKLQRSSVSRTINELENDGLVRCLTPKERMGRLYQLTKLGKKLLRILETKNNIS